MLLNSAVIKFREAKESNFYYSSPRMQKIMELLRLKEKRKKTDWVQPLVDSLNRTTLKNKQ